MLRWQMESHKWPGSGGNSHQAPSKNGHKCRTMDRWKECTHYLGWDLHLPLHSGRIWRERCPHQRFGDNIVGSNFLALKVGRTLTFCWCHGGMFDWNRWINVFEEEDTMKKKRNEKVFCISDVKGIILSTDDINVDVKRCNGSSIKKRHGINEKLCFRITAKFGNSKRQHCSQQERKWKVAHC